MTHLPSSNELIEVDFPMNESSIEFATKHLRYKSRDREVYSNLIQLHAENEWLLADLSSIMTYMCKLHPPEFVMVSFAVELHRFMQSKDNAVRDVGVPRPSDLNFVSAFIQNMNHVIFNTEEAIALREVLKDCVICKADTDEYHRRSRVFQILHHSFSHNIASTVTMCLWVGAYRTAYLVINTINPLDINLMFLLEIDRLIELLERPLFR
jgi:Vacuolar protein 14 C-terminal Fig4p binding